MNIELIKKFLDVCQEAKKVTELTPKLPNGMKPRHIHVIDKVYALSQRKEYVKVSDVSEELKVTKPSITKLINELEDQNVIVKNSSNNDNRITTITLTSLGKEYYEIYVDKYHNWLAELFSDIDEKDMMKTIETISKAYEIMKLNKMKVNEGEKDSYQE